MKKTELWISRDKYVEIWQAEPWWKPEKWDSLNAVKIGGYWQGPQHKYTFCGAQFRKLIPCLCVPKDIKCRLRITHYKSGDKLSLVGKPIKAGE